MQMNGTIDRLFTLTSSSTANGQKAEDESSGGAQTAALEAKLKKQEQQINKLKHQKKEMVKMVNNKMTDLKFYHQQELQKERQIANVLVENHRKKYEALLERTGHSANANVSHSENYEMAQMKQQME